MDRSEYAHKTDKEVKKLFKKEASKEPDKYYATSVLKAEGFKRKQCKCGTYFWTVNEEQNRCGDSSCSGGFDFFKDNPCKKKLTFTSVWTEFSKMFKELGYTPIPRYPIVARWRPDMEFTIASIADFQPYVVSGEVNPPANPLVVPQFCLRFGDVDNVGITGSHMTCFNMIGQHKFVPPEDWNQEELFRHIHTWLKEGLGLPNEEITFHEDAWAGGGNFGPCMEFFSRGLEIGNQVYMLYINTEDGMEELNLKVLDMGMGMERCAWISQGTPTIYDATFPKVIEKLKEKTGITIDKELVDSYVPYAGHLDFDEAEDMDVAWDFVAKKVGLPVAELKAKIFPMVSLYSIAEHARGLLIAITDGGMPSNVGGGYNLRMILRRALSAINKQGWNIDLFDVCEWHAEELKEIFPELSDNLGTVKTIINVEKEKYLETLEKSKNLVGRMLTSGEEITEETLLELYDSNGISPDMFVEQALKLGRTIVPPEDFYTKVAALHEKKSQKTSTKKEEDLPISDVGSTTALYFDDFKLTDFEAKVLWELDGWVVLDKTAFYPTSGGQMADRGFLIFDGKKCEVIDVIKQGPYIVHKIKDCDLHEGDNVKGEIDFARREQLTQHHTGTHIINAAAKRILGSHIFQAGAAKSTEKARLDVTHYESISKEDLQKIEDEANKIISENHPVIKKFIPRNLAEAEYGFSLYQGGAVPGKEIRVVDIPEVDAEACGGTHLDFTGEAIKIKIIKTTKVQDGIVRIEFAAGKAAETFEKKDDSVVAEVAKLLSVPVEQIPGRAQELFTKWKKAKKALKKKKDVDVAELELKSTEKITSEDIEEAVLSKTSEVLNTQAEHLPKTIKRFLDELEEMKEKLSESS